MSNKEQLPVAIIGAGPVGLAAAAHLHRYNIPFKVFESGNTAGHNVLSWKHVHVFSPWKYNIDKAARELLLKTSWQLPSEDLIHNGREFYEHYLKPLSQLPELSPHIYLNCRVISIGRRNMDKMKTKSRDETPFVINILKAGESFFYEAQAVIDASGTWQNPNPAGAGGYYAKGEKENASHIFYGIPDVMGKHKNNYAGKRVLVVGSGHSAINALIELEKLKQEFALTEISWVLRKQHLSDMYGGRENDALEARGNLGTQIERLVNQNRISIYTPFQVKEIRHSEKGLTIIGVQNGKSYQLPEADEIVVGAGSRPDFSFLREVRLAQSPLLESVSALENLIDPNIHSCGTVRAHGEKELRQPEKNFYIVGSKSYGRAPTFLMATGYEQVRSVVAALAGDTEAAERTELDLPETGVCSSNGNAACCVN